MPQIKSNRRNRSTKGNIFRSTVVFFLTLGDKNNDFLLSNHVDLNPGDAKETYHVRNNFSDPEEGRREG